MITEKDIRAMFPECRNTSEFSLELSRVFSLREILSPPRAWMFMAQVGHESQGLTRMVENLNYSAKGLMKIWPRRFPSIDVALQFERRPEAIANKVYSNRLGNGPEESGDGWRYRGRGLIQVTGKSNYRACAAALSVEFKDVHEYLETVRGACESAGWFWETINGNYYADQGDLVGCTRRVNGGLIGLDERRRIYELAKEVLKG